MSKTPCKVEDAHGNSGIIQHASIPGITRMFFIISVSGNVPASARPGIDV